MDNKNHGGLTKRNLWSFSIGGIGRDLAGSLFSSYIITFVLFTKSLSDSQFAAISMTMFAAGIFDALNDPVMGNIIEVTRTKWGKFKPWITIGMILTSIVFCISFSNNLQGWNYVILFAVMYFLYSIVFTMNDISYWGMLPSLARRKNDRDTLTSRAVLFAGIGSGLTTIIVPTFTAGDKVIGGNALTAYSFLAFTFCAVFIVLQSVTIFGVKEEPLKELKQIEKVGIKTIVKVIKNNDQLMWCMLIFILHQISFSVINGVISSNYIYFEFGYKGMLFTLFVGLGAIVTALVMIFFSSISKRFSRDKLMKISITAIVSGFIFMLIVGLFVPTKAGMFKYVLLMVGNLFSFGGMGVYYLIMMISIANTVEYNEWRTGERAEGIIFSIRPFITKCAHAAMQLIVLLVFSIVGVREVTNQISDLENAVSKGLIDTAAKSEQISNILSNVPSGKSRALIAFMTLLPMFMLLISYRVYKKKYIITEEKYDEITEELNARKATKKAAAIDEIKN